MVTAIKALEGSDQKATHRAFLFIGEVATFNVHGRESDVEPEANNEHLTADELQSLKRTLIDFVERNPYSPFAGSAIWALGNFSDPDTIPIYRTWLKRYVDQSLACTGPIGQIAAVIAPFGEKIITGGHFNAGEHRKNLDDAIAYLQRLEKASKENVGK